MNWRMMDLAVRGLNISALREWKSIFQGMNVWMQAIVVGALVLLTGASLLSCWWGLKMKRAARFAAGAVSVFFIVLILLSAEYSIELTKALIYSAAAAAAGGFLYAFLERVFQFAAGFVLGTVLSAYLLPEYLHLKVTSGKGRIWALVIAIAAGVLFALLAKKLKWVLTALEGGIVLGLLCEVFFPVTEIPWIEDRLSAAQILNLLPLVIAASGVVIQLIQLLAIRAEKKALEIPTGDERDHFDSREHAGGGASDVDDQSEAQPVDEDAVSMAQAEEVLVEKAKELALAATRSAEQARLKERYEDVSAGLYSSQVAAQRLGMSEEAFVLGMKKAGYTVPETKDTQKSREEERPEDSRAEGSSAEESVESGDSSAEESEERRKEEKEDSGAEDAGDGQEEEKEERKQEG